MKLVDLNPRWVGAGGEGIFTVDPETGAHIPSKPRHGVGVSFNCPCGCGTDCFIPFGNALDGEVWDRKGWHRKGDTFETLTLTPSIQRVGGCGWHGHITDGEIRNA